MSGELPVEHVQESLKLQAALPVDMWEFALRSGARVYLRDGQACNWNHGAGDKPYMACSCKLTGEAEHADDTNAKPLFTLVDKERVIGPYAAAGLLDLAIVYRRRIHQSHLAANLPIFQQRIWLVGRVANVGNQQVQLELRSPHDIPDFIVPPRMYMPPEFPFVTY